MMVMPGKPLGQLVAGEAFRPEVMGDDTRLLEYREGPVQGREGHLGADQIAQLGGRHRAGRIGQRGHDGSAPPGEPSVVIEQTLLDLALQARFDHGGHPNDYDSHCHDNDSHSTHRMRGVPSRKPRSARSWLAAPALLIAALLLVGCGEAAEGGEGLTVVATTSIWGDVVAEIVAGHGEVETLVPRGADAHDYQASPQQGALIRGADLVVANGLGLEEGLEDVLDAAAADGALIFEVAPALNPLPLAGDGPDPHVWFDPARLADAARLIADRLEEIMPGIDWGARAEEYAGSLATLDAEIETTLSEIDRAQRKLVTNHESLGYFAARYDFEVVGVVIPGGSTLSQPSSAALADLVARVEEESVPAIFAETSSPIRLAEAVAGEAGEVVVVELHTESLGEPGSGAETLIGLLRSNARKIADALG